MNRTILTLAALLLLLWPASGQACPLTKPELVTATQADYYASMRWEMTVTFRGPAAFPEPTDSMSFLWDYSFNWAGQGPDVTVDMQNVAGDPQVNWSFYQHQDSEGCWEATYSDTAVGEVVNDAPEKPSFCVPNAEFPSLCLARGLEGAGLEIVDTAGNDSGEIDFSKPCFHTGRGADCVGP